MQNTAQRSPPAWAHGVAFGLLMTLFFWVRDAIEGSVPPWPRWALGYGLAAVLAGVLYGCFYWWLERRYARRP